MYRALADAIRDAEHRGTTLARLALDTEAKDQGRTVSDIRDALRRALEVMRGAVQRGMTGDLVSASGLVGGDAAKLRTGPPGPLAGTPFRDVLARALAVQESSPRPRPVARACSPRCSPGSPRPVASPTTRSSTRSPWPV
jgi:L-serine dehydratase